MCKAVFLDKDGTINEDRGYLHDPAHVEILPGSAQAIKELNEAGYKVIVVSNQAGIARGYMTEDQLQAVDKTLRKKILSAGGHIDDLYYCPHHPEIGLHPYKKVCECRKPEPGMLKKAAKEHLIDLSQSYMIGDKATDIEAGKRAGTKTIFVTSGRGQEEKPKLKEPPDHIAKDLLDAVKWMLSHDRNS